MIACMYQSLDNVVPVCLKRIIDRNAHCMYHCLHAAFLLTVCLGSITQISSWFRPHHLGESLKHFDHESWVSIMTNETGSSETTEYILFECFRYLQCPVALIVLAITNPIKWSWNSRSAVFARQVTGKGLKKFIDTTWKVRSDTTLTDGWHLKWGVLLLLLQSLHACMCFVTSA